MENNIIDYIEPTRKHERFEFISQVKSEMDVIPSALELKQQIKDSRAIREQKQREEEYQKTQKLKRNVMNNYILAIQQINTVLKDYVNRDFNNSFYKSNSFTIKLLYSLCGLEKKTAITEEFIIPGVKEITTIVSALNSEFQKKGYTIEFVAYLRWNNSNISDGTVTYQIKLSF